MFLYKASLILKSNTALFPLQVTLKLFVFKLQANYCRKKFGSENWFCDKGAGLILFSENNFNKYSKKSFLVFKFWHNLRSHLFHKGRGDERLQYIDVGYKNWSNELKISIQIP